ncbi:MAG TPA: PAS domain S-box protein [Vicinamibacterales bacterium]
MTPVEPLDAPTLTVDLDGSIQAANPAAERLFGRPAAGLVGRAMAELAPPEFQEEDADLRERVRRGERIERFETVRLAAGGQRIDVSISITPIRGLAGQPVGWAVTYRDITWQKRHEAYAYLAAIVQSSDDAIVSKDLDGTIRSYNPAAERLYGYRAAELIGRNVKVLVPPELHAEEDALLERLTRGERVEHVETVRLARDGRRIDVSLSISPVRDESGAIIGASKVARDITERRRAAATQALLAAIVESSDDAILSKDLDGVIQTCNAATERLFGYTREELVGRPVRMLIPPELQSEEDEILARLRRGERTDHFETVRIAKDGRRIDISLTISPLKNEAGVVVGASKIARDITERKRAVAELAAQREWFRVTLDSIGDGVVACGPDGRINFLNGMAERLTGWSSAEAQGRQLAEVFRIVNEETREPVVNPAVLVMRTGQIVGLANHTLLISRSGQECPVADSAAPIKDAEGKLIGVVIVFRDVTEERRAEEALAEQREWLETTLESIGDAVIATDVQGRVVFMNPVAEQLTGYGAGEARGRPCADVFRIVSEETRRPAHSPVARVLEEGVVVGLANHTLLVARDGTERPIDDSGAPILNREGRIVGVVLVFRDVTERRRGETERQQAAAERERLLESERAARAEAERASRVKDEFVAMVSHELRTPLNAILGWTQLMMRSRNDPAVIERGLDVVARNTRVQAQLISDLLDISRIVSGKLRLELQLVDLRAIALDAIETVFQDAVAKGIRVHRDLAEVGPVAGDPARLQQVVWNLLANAIKFTPPGGRVDVGLRQAGGNVELTVSDTGVGIRREALPHVFDRFHQIDRSITRRFGGLGLGLSIVKNLTEAHGGTVQAASEGEGKGATFTVLLPAASAAQIPERHDEPAHPRETVSQSLDGVRVLVVEDEPDTREFVRRLLDSHGAVVTEAATAGEALELYERTRPHVLISDVGLPEIDGYELLRLIRERVAANGVIPAIALTAYAGSQDRMRALHAGYQAHLAKPVEPNELIATVATFRELTDAQRRRDDHA